MKRQNVTVVGFLLVLLTGDMLAQSGQFKLGSQLWYMDSVSHFAVPTNSDIVMAIRTSDSSLSMLDARTGVVQRILFRPVQELGNHVAVSNDGRVCCLSNEMYSGDSSQTTRAFDLSDGSILWERKEFAAVFAVSSRLNRSLHRVVKYTNGFGEADIDLVDLTDGHTIRTFEDGWAPYACFDEDNGRFYVAHRVWQGQVGAWIIEFDAASGTMIRKWNFTHGPMAKMPGHDTLYVMRENTSAHDERLEIYGLDLSSDARGMATDCDPAQPGTCFHGEHARLNVGVGEHSVFTSWTSGNLGLGVFDIDSSTGKARPLLFGNLIWEGKVVIPYSHYELSPSRGLFYAIPQGPGFSRRPLICASLELNTSAMTSDADIDEREIHVVEDATYVLNLRGVSEPSEVHIVNIAGQVVLTRPLDVRVNALELDIASLAPGFYICRILHSSGALSRPFVHSH